MIDIIMSTEETTWYPSSGIDKRCSYCSN